MLRGYKRWLCYADVNNAVCRSSEEEGPFRRGIGWRNVSAQVLKQPTR